jgi:hypothetical protein
MGVMADGFEPNQLVPVLPAARLHAVGGELARMAVARMKRSLLMGTIVAVTWLMPIIAVMLAILFS